MGATPNLNQTVRQFDKPERLVDRIFIHCSASSNPNLDAQEVDRWHRDDNGWSAIGYHYFIKTDGTVQYGRDIERTPAAQSGHNKNTIAICLNGLNLSDFTNEQYEALFWLCDKINTAYGGRITFHGHNEVAAKACPVIDCGQVLGLDPQGYMKVGAQPVDIEPIALHKMKVSRAFVGASVNNRHYDVRLAQGLLHAHGYGYYVGSVDGIAGSQFDAACRKLQKDNNLTADGVCGEETWEILEDAGN